MEDSTGGEKVLAIIENLTFNNFLQVVDDITILESYLNLGLGQGWINNMNFLIITKEYHLIKASLLKEISNPKSQITKDIVNNSVIQDRVKLKYSQRQQQILKILNKREKAQVADFIKELPKVTKRTIRRDLDDLLKRGEIVRVGEWNQVVYQKMS